MKNSSDDNGLLFMGGAVGVVVIGAIVVKAVNEFVIELEVTFNNFGKMMGSFLSMAWNTFAVVTLFALAISAVVSGVYFIIRYIKAIKEVTDNRRFLDLGIANVQSDIESVESRAKARENKVRDDLLKYIGQVQDQLRDALSQKASLTDIPKTQTLLVTNPTTSQTAAIEMSAAQENKAPTQDAPKDVTQNITVQMSNPY